MPTSYSVFICNSSPMPVAVHDDGDVLRQRCAGFGAQMGCGGTHSVCQQITRIARIQKVKPPALKTFD